MEIITLAQARYLAGIYDDDNDLVQDLKLQAWLAGRKYRVVSKPQLDSLDTESQDLDLLITKEET